MATIENVTINGETHEVCDTTARFTASHARHFVVDSEEEMNQLLIPEYVRGGGEITCEVVDTNASGNSKRKLFKLIDGKWHITQNVNNGVNKWFDENYVTFADEDLEAVLLSAITTEDPTSISKKNGETDTLTTISFANNNDIEYIYELGNFKNLVPKEGMFANMRNVKEIMWTEKTPTISGSLGYITTNGSGWDCGNLEYLNLTGWDTSNVTSLGYTTAYYGMFGGVNRSNDTKFVVDLSGWDTSKVKSLYRTFSNILSYNFESKLIGIENWNTSAVTDMTWTFCNNYLREINIENWDWSNVTTMDCMFNQCMWARKIILPKNSKSSKCTNFYRFFRNANELTDENVVNFDSIDVSNATNISSFFYQALLRSVVDLTSWDCSNVTTNVTFFIADSNFRSLIGDHTIEEVERGDVTVLKGLSVNIELRQRRFIQDIVPNLERASLLAVIKGVADMTGKDTKTITLNQEQLDRLTDDDKAIAASKNWVLAAT